jgi:hypothetical protein
MTGATKSSSACRSAGDQPWVRCMAINCRSARTPYRWRPAQFAAKPWRSRQHVSPGIVMTPLPRDELTEPQPTGASFRIP